MLTNKIKTDIRSSFEAAKKVIPDFKIRRTQNKMIAEISKSLSAEYPQKNPILCVEAPTGTGKTMAYLLAAIPIAKAGKKKLVIASANVALQEQLLFKDIPQAQKYCTQKFEYALAKGRARYVCVRNLIQLNENQSQQTSFFEPHLTWDSPPKKHQLAQLDKLLKNYSTQKWNGEIDDLERHPEPLLWQKINCNRFTCTAKKCEFYADCAFFKARQKISKADVIIANHDLILADLNAGNTILPLVEECIFIFDEAHHLSQKALSHFSLTTSIEHIKTSIKQTLSVVDQISKITQQDRPNNNLNQLDGYLDDLVNLLKDLDFDEGVHLFHQGVVDEAIKIVLQNLQIAFNLLKTQFERLKEAWADYLKIQTIDKIQADLINNTLGECEQHLTAISALLISILSIDETNKPPHSRWISKTVLANKKTNYTLNSAQIDVSDHLHQLIWSKLAGAILTSATLSSLGSFARFNQQLGLIEAENQYLRLPSPFALKQTDFIIAKFKNSPLQVSEHTQEVASQLLKRIDTTAGSLVLFASNKQMQAVADLVDKKLNCDLFVQGEYSKKQILEKHINLRQKGKGSIIFGLDSFAEGVDLKADNLTHVVIIKLRFSVPNSPIEKTTQDYLKSQKRNPFMEISLPDASLRLIQACGRLIRSETDTGKITIFDNRLISKFYGKQLLDSLPDYNIVVE